MRFVSRFLCLVAVVLGTLVAPPPLMAAVPTLDKVGIQTAPKGGATVTLTFVGGTPTYQVSGQGTPEPSLVFQSCQLATDLPSSFAGVGPINSVAVEQTTNLVGVALHLRGSSALRVRAVGPQLVIDVGFAPATSAASGAELPAATPSPQSAALGLVTQVIPLKYADISEVAGLLVQGANVPSNDTFQPQTANIGSTSMGSGGGFGGVQASAPTQNFPSNPSGAEQGLAQRVSDNVAVDRRLNAIILTGSPGLVGQLRAFIATIDIPVDSVLLDTEVLELDENAAKNVGIDFAPGGNQLVASGSLTIPSNSTSNIGGVATTPSTVSLAAQLYAEIDKGNGRILSRPRILAESGQQASILTGDAIPIITSVVVTGSSALTSQQVNYVNVGVNLQIAPRVSSDGFVTTHIYCEVSSVEAYVQGIPEISQRTASTIATVKDGEPLVIGGLLQTSELKSLAKLPFIGDLPLIGSLFQHVDNSYQKTDLYVVVIPHIIRTVSPPVGASPAP
ncbi:MAG: secretin N-terminal domain-containing protein [Candidatus Aquilonibacter sp.]|jgi:general secretion pathway protein D